MQGESPTRALPRLGPLESFTGSLAQKAYASLKQAILDLEFRPGEALRKPEICDHYGISRSPVSEAVARLAAEGLVDVVPQAGTFVARFSMEEIREGAFLREALEVAAVERVAERASEDQVTQLRRNIRVQEALVADGDYVGFYQTDSQMHELIQGFTGFRRLVVLTDTAWVHVNRARRLTLPHQGRVQEALIEHQRIVEAIAAHDPEAARLAMRHHLRQLVRLLEGLVETRPDLFAPGG